MNSKLLTERPFKVQLTKNKIKDNGLQRALACYEKIDDDQHDELLDQLEEVRKLAAGLKKDKGVTANEEVVSYLEDMLDAADSEEKGINKDKATAKKSAAAEQKQKEDNEAEEEEDEQEEQEGEYGDQLLAALRKVKSGVPMSFVLCEARPLPAIMVAKRISAKHRKQLTEITGGSKKFRQIGTCSYEDGKYVFSTDRQVPGLAQRLQRSLKNYTGKKLKILCGDETEESDEDVA